MPRKDLKEEDVVRIPFEDGVGLKNYNLPPKLANILPGGDYRYATSSAYKYTINMTNGDVEDACVFSKIKSLVEYEEFVQKLQAFADCQLNPENTKLGKTARLQLRHRVCCKFKKDGHCKAQIMLSKFKEKSVPVQDSKLYRQGYVTKIQITWTHFDVEQCLGAVSKSKPNVQHQQVQQEPSDEAVAIQDGQENVAPTAGFPSSDADEANAGGNETEQLVLVQNGETISQAPTNREQQQKPSPNDELRITVKLTGNTVEVIGTEVVSAATSSPHDHRHPLGDAFAIEHHPQVGDNGREAAGLETPPFFDEGGAIDEEEIAPEQSPTQPPIADKEENDAVYIVDSVFNELAADRQGEREPPDDAAAIVHHAQLGDIESGTGLQRPAFPNVDDHEDTAHGKRIDNEQTESIEASTAIMEEDQIIIPANVNRRSNIVRSYPQNDRLCSDALHHDDGQEMTNSDANIDDAALLAAQCLLGLRKGNETDNEWLVEENNICKSASIQRVEENHRLHWEMEQLLRENVESVAKLRADIDRLREGKKEWDDEKARLLEVIVELRQENDQRAAGEATLQTTIKQLRSAKLECAADKGRLQSIIDALRKEKHEFAVAVGELESMLRRQARIQDCVESREEAEEVQEAKEQEKDADAQGAQNEAKKISNAAHLVRRRRKRVDEAGMEESSKKAKLDVAEAGGDENGKKAEEVKE